MLIVVCERITKINEIKTHRKVREHHGIASINIQNLEGGDNKTNECCIF